MDRRQVLQVGAALVALPLAGCGGSAPEPRTAPVDTGKAAIPEKPPAPVDTAVAAAKDPPVAPPGDKEPAPAPAAKDAPKYDFARVIGRVGKNHGHEIVIPFADVKAGAEKTYDLTGTSNHLHELTLSVDEMKQLLAGESIRKKSTRGSQHQHKLWVRCGPAVDPPEWVSACTVTFSGQDEHELIVPAADLTAAADKTYDMQGIADHKHEVTLTAGDFAEMGKNKVIKRISTQAAFDSHTHVVLVNRTPAKKA
jgi:hypothetical protein